TVSRSLSGADDCSDDLRASTIACLSSSLSDCRSFAIWLALGELVVDGSCAGGDVSGSVVDASTPDTPSLNSRMPLPSDRPISGRRLAPNTSRSTTSKMRSSGNPTPKGTDRTLASGWSAKQVRLPWGRRAVSLLTEVFIRSGRSLFRMAQLEIRNLHV